MSRTQTDQTAINVSNADNHSLGFVKINISESHSPAVFTKPSLTVLR